MICGNDAIKFYKQRIEELEMQYELDKSKDSLELINSFNMLLKKERYNLLIFELINDLRWRSSDKKNFALSFKEIGEIELETILQMDDILEKNLKLDSSNLVVFEHDMSSKSSLELVDDFFYSLNSKLLLDEYIKIRDNNLPNIYLVKSTLIEENHGLTIFDHLSNNSFSKINMSGTLCDPITIAHEIMHMIFFNLFKYEENYSLREVEGFFSDYIFADFLQKKQITKYSPLQINYESFYPLKESCKIVKKANNFFNNKNKLPFISYKEEPSFNVDYNLSYLAALDLFFVYLEDSNYAIDELFQLVKKDKNVIINLFNNNKYNNFYRDDFKNLRYTLEYAKKTK